MTKEAFDNYSFGVSTVIRTAESDGWESITEVDFRFRTVETEFYGTVPLDKILEIKD